MDDNLAKIVGWANRGTPKQFHIELSARLADTEYEAKLSEDAITCYRVTKEGGILGIGARTKREPVLVLRVNGETIEAAETPRDAEFIALLASMLRDH